MRYTYDPENPPGQAELAEAWRNTPKHIRDFWTSWWERYHRYLARAYYLLPWGWLPFYAYGYDMFARSPYAQACRNWRWQMLEYGWWDTELVVWVAGDPEYSEPDLIPADGVPYTPCVDQFELPPEDRYPEYREKYRIPKSYRGPNPTTRKNL